MAPKLDKDLENLHEEWLSDPLLKDAAKLRVQIISAIEKMSTLESATSQNLSNPLKRANTKRALADIQKTKAILQNVSNELHNLMTAAQPLGSTSGFPRVRPDDFNSRLSVITFRGKEDLKITNHTALDETIRDIYKKLTALENKNLKSNKKRF